MIAVNELTDYDKIKEIVLRIGQKRSNLLPILDEVQKINGNIDSDTQQIIADLLNIHPVEVFGAISFYHFLHHENKGKKIVRLCKSISCELNEKEKIKNKIESIIGIKAGETTPDGEITFEEINCFGLCDIGPALMINDKVYTKLTETKAEELISELLENKS